MTAPTPNEIVARRGSLMIHCDRCRMIKAPVDLLEHLIAADRGDLPIDQMTFRCTRCGEVGWPLSQGPGNSVVGREQLWPPADA